MTSILFLAANPAHSDRLALDWEHRRIEEALEGSPRKIHLEAAWAVDLDRLQVKLLNTRPAVIHFGGHGARSGILLESVDEPGLVTPDVLAGLIGELAGGIQLAVLNACYTDAFAECIAKVVPCAVLMRGAVHDGPTASFAKSFYRVLGHGRAVGTAFRTALHALRQESLDAEAPRLVVADGVDADDVFPLAGELTSPLPKGPNMAPLPPATWVPHKQEARLVGALDPSLSRDRRARCMAIIGGDQLKSYVARAVAHDPKVKEWYTRGILWVSLGAEGRPIEGLSAIYAALAGEQPRFSGVDDARHAVASVIGEQSCLLIVDDVARAEQLAPFLNWGPSVARLITARDGRVHPPADPLVMLEGKRKLPRWLLPALVALVLMLSVMGAYILKRDEPDPQPNPPLPTTGTSTTTTATSPTTTDVTTTNDTTTGTTTNDTTTGTTTSSATTGPPPRRPRPDFRKSLRGELATNNCAEKDPEGVAEIRFILDTESGSFREKKRPRPCDGLCKCVISAVRSLRPPQYSNKRLVKHGTICYAPQSAEPILLSECI